MELIFDETHSHRALPSGNVDDIPAEFLRREAPALPVASELHVVRHYTRLSQQNFSIDTHFYPLGSCTMKYNPRACNRLAMLPGFLGRHPLGDVQFGQGFMHCLYDVQEWLSEITGLSATSLVPMAGAQGEFAGVAMIRAYHQSRQDTERTEILVPDAAHGTNPASAVMCGFTVKEIPCNSDGDIDPDVLRSMVGPQTAGIMLTNPSTLGVFERKIQEVADIVHQAGGLLYYDGANLNAIMGKVRPGDMGFDVVHINLHKTFSTPHGGGGPGSGPVCVSERLMPFLPVPFVAQKDGAFVWQDETACPQTIGRLSAFMGNAGVLLRAWVYMQLLGGDGLKRVSDYATLNANYLMKRLSDAGFDLAYPGRRATHEFIVTLKNVAEEHHISAMDVAKRLLDYGYHAPTTYFPLLIPECFLIEPTETESKATLDAFVEAMISILKEIETEPDKLKNAPISQPVRRLDEVKAAREPDLAYTGVNS